MSDKPSIEFELESPESWKRVAKVSVSPEHMDVIREAVVQDLRKKAKLPGFRAGKVPANIIRTQYAGQVEQEALERVIPEAYRTVLDSSKELEPVSEPKVSNLSLDEGEPVGFDLEIEVRPAVELQGLSSLDVERIKLLIDDVRVDKAMAELAERNAQWAPVERGATEGDALQIGYVPLDEEGKPREDDRVESYAMELGGEGVLPEFNSALVGLQPGEDTTVEVSYPDDYPREDLAGQTMSFTVKLDEVKEKRIPELDDDFAQSVSPHKTLAELREAVEKDLTRAAETESDRHFREALVDEILKANEVPVPPSLEARYLHAILSDFERGSGQELDEKAKEQLSERYRPSASRAVQRLLVLDSVRKDQDVEVSDEDLAARIEEMASERGTTAEEYRRAIEASSNMGRLRNDLEEDRIFDWLTGQVQVTVVEKSSDEIEDEQPGASAAGAGA